MRGRELKLAGQKFGRLTVIERLRQNANRQVVWLCRCDCGQTREVTSSDLTSGKRASCGCTKGGARDIRPRERANRKALVKAAKASGATQYEIADLLKISQPTVSRDLKND